MMNPKDEDDDPPPLMEDDDSDNEPTNDDSVPDEQLGAQSERDDYYGPPHPNTIVLYCLEYFHFFIAMLLLERFL